MFLRNCWYVVAWAKDLAPGQLMPVMTLGEPIVLFRKGDGEVVALTDRCPHRLAPLSKGRLEGDYLRCMYHGLKFNTAGACVEIPGQEQISKAARVRKYPAVERHSWIWIWMGEEAAADADLIPPAIGLDDPNWLQRAGQMDYRANYQLINDNLTDFSHLAYVHANSFGASEEWARTRPTVQRLERGIRVQRWLSGDSGFLRDPNIAVWQSYDYLAPGVLIMVTGFYPATARTEANEGEPSGKPLFGSVTSQAVTPTSETTTRYFFCTGPNADHPDADAQAEAQLAMALAAFAEDREMIEAQQATIDLSPDVREILTNADVGPTQMRQVLLTLKKQEDALREPAA